MCLLSIELAALIDNNFKQIANMRHGIYGWVKNNFPVVR